ncbi:MAG TPA: 6-hydroxymethylpterin diphosphokinase MptE-like protein, partial [Rectinemataceae bacterium]|nr:6-hydroxymethylpterin diphosphokinase MptE-like protein [Rectinemataceae bacterium]
SSTSAPSPRNSDGDEAGGGSTATGLQRAAVELVFSSGEENVLAKGRLLYPERGPSRFAVRVALASLDEARKSGPARLFLVASPCLWYGVAELLSGLPEDGAVLCIETDPALAAIAETRIPPSIRDDPRLRFVPGRDSLAWIEAAADLGRFRRVQALRLSGGFDPGELGRIAALLDEAFSAWWKNRASLAAMGRLWVRNIFRNLARMDEIGPRPLETLMGPTLVCGAGPSLEDAIPFIRANRASLNVVAADTAVGSLAEGGVLPDLVVCLEAQIWNLRDFIGMERACGEKPLDASPSFTLLADLSSHPSSFRIPGASNSLSCVGITDGPFIDRLRSAGLRLLAAPPLGSVGVHALHVARRLSTGPLFVAGLDFSFVAGKTHARGTSAALSDLLSASRLLPVLGRGLVSSFREEVRAVAAGGTELSDPVLSRYAALLAEELRASGPPVYDLRGGRGLPLGIPALSLAQAERLLAETPRKGAGARLSPRSGSRAFQPPAPPEGSPSAATASEAGEAGRAFLVAERARLIDLEAALRGDSGARREDLAATIGDIEYILWPMPDADRIRSLPQDLLNRVLVETEYWIGLIGELAET